MKYWITFEVDSPIDTEHEPGTKEFYEIVMERAFHFQGVLESLSVIETAAEDGVDNATQQKYEVTEWDVYDDDNGKIKNW